VSGGKSEWNFKRRVGGPAALRVRENKERRAKFFNGFGCIGSARWWRQQSILMAKRTYTPVYFWLDTTIAEFFAWIEDLNFTEKKHP
jgi:hypothetical protein